MAVAPTVLVIGDEQVVRPYVEALSSIWLTAAAPEMSHLRAVAAGARSGDAVLVELQGTGCNVRIADESLTLAQRPSPEDLRALVGLVIRIAEFDRQLRLVEEMEPLGIMACSIAHDANNLLAIVMGSLWELGRTCPVESSRVSLVQTAEQATLRVGGLLKRLLSFRKDNTSRNVSLNAVIEDLLPTLRSLVGPLVAVSEDLAPALPDVGWDVLAVEQILINLVANARDALPLGGRIEIITRAEPSEAVKGAAPAVDGLSRVVLEVKDNGTGMLHETLLRAFEPLFTTKPPGQGTGLGLKSVRRLVTRAGGAIDLDSRPGHGTKVTIRLPASN
jgi:two-component system, cell cycle sensor histidine kinase and response regulator CckA